MSDLLHLNSATYLTRAESRTLAFVGSKNPRELSFLFSLRWFEFKSSSSYFDWFALDQ